MKTLTFLATFMFVFLAVTGNAFSYEGGTKALVVMTHPEKGEADFSPLLVIPHDELTPSKPVQRLLRQIPEPTLSLERIREEIPGPSLGTKAVVLFQKRR